MKIRLVKFCNSGLVIILVVILFAPPALSNVCNYTHQAKMNFWSKQQKGANIFNQSIHVDDIKAAKAYGIKFIRLAPDKFITNHRDFLIGNADDYRGLVKEDLEKLKKILDVFQEQGVPIVITMLSLPGSRWKQNNSDQDDLRIWKEEKYRQQAARYWKELATALKDHPAVVGYNILNEPHLERIYDSKSIHISEVEQEEVQTMLYNFYKLIINSIRSVDQHTPIILESSAYADSQTFKQMKPHDDKNLLYSFHIYEPYEYTNKQINQGKFRYPGNIAGKQWGKEELKEYMAPVVKFQQSYNIPNSKILVGEFGGHRMSAGLEQYFKDLIAIFDQQGWHFGFYAFREDTWEGMDYELGNKPLPQGYWDAIAKGQKPQVVRKSTYPAFSIIKEALEEREIAKSISKL